MRKRSIIPILLSALLMCACSGYADAAKPAYQSLVDPVASNTLKNAAEPTDAVTEPDLSLHIDAGSHRLTYTDPQTGDYLDYYLFIPQNATVDMPLIIFLHGDGEVGNIDSLESYGMIAKAREIYGDAFPFLAISPCTRIKSWTDGTIPGTLKGLIDETVASCQADPDRIILTGHSRGSIGTWNMISTYGDYFAAAVPVSCPRYNYVDFDNFQNVPIYAFAGNVGSEENHYANEMQILVNQINANGGDAVLTILDGNDHSEMAYSAYTEETIQWMLQQ